MEANDTPAVPVDGGVIAIVPPAAAMSVEEAVAAATAATAAATAAAAAANTAADTATAAAAAAHATVAEMDSVRDQMVAALQQLMAASQSGKRIKRAIASCYRTMRTMNASMAETRDGLDELVNLVRNMAAGDRE